jgi:5'-deoxynucleotidase YfbR-like HD superfamily hydrolase
MAFAKIHGDIAWNAIETASGRYVDVSDPQPKDISITDIAWSLSRQARFAGHTLSEEIWSVAQHALFVEKLLDLVMEGFQLEASLIGWMLTKYPTDTSKTQLLDWISPDRRLAIQLGALHHDDSEAYLIDLPSPVKRILSLREPYKKLEGAVTSAISMALELPELTEIEHDLIGWADLMALQIEAANMMPSRGRGWGMELPKMNLADIYLFPKPAHWKQVYEQFLKRDHDMRER